MALAYGEIRATFERQGPPIGVHDLWIAAQALNAELVADILREFSRLAGLALINGLR